MKSYIRWRKEKIRFAKGAGGPGAPKTIHRKVHAYSDAGNWYTNPKRRSRYDTARGWGYNSRKSGMIRDFGRYRYGEVKDYTSKYKPR